MGQKIKNIDDVDRLAGYYSLREIANIIGLRKQTIKNAIEKGEIRPIFHVDGFYVIPYEAVDNFIARRKGIEDGRYKVK